MEIRIRRRLTGHQLRAEVLDTYGDRETIEGKAEAGDPDAQDALFNLDLLEEDPGRLDEHLVVEDVLQLERNDLSKLTETRLHILDVLRKTGETNLKDLTATLRRDPKNVSRDVAYLESFGLIEAHRRGKEKWLQVSGNEIVVSI